MPFIGAKVALKAGNELLTCNSSSLSFTTYRAIEDRPAVVFYVPSGLNNVFVQAYNRKFVTIDNTTKIITLKDVTDTTIGLQDSFNFACLGMNLVAIQSNNNGKYLHLDDTTKTLIADSDAIGVKETFETIIVFR